MIILACTAFLAVLPGRSQDGERTVVKRHYGTHEVAMMDPLRLQGTDYDKFGISASSFADKMVELSYVEHKDGQLLGELPFVNGDDMASLMGFLEKDSPSHFRVIAQKNSPDSVKFLFLSLFLFLDKMDVDRAFEILQRNPSYSLRTALKNSFQGESGNRTEGDRIAIDEKLPLLIHALRYADPGGGWRYGQLTAEGIPPEKWGAHYGKDHSILFYLTISSAREKGEAPE